MLKYLRPNKWLHSYLRAREYPVVQGQGEWGDHAEILALEEVFDRPIEIYAYESGTTEPRKTHLTELPPELEGVTPFRLTYHGANHYNAVDMRKPGDGEHLPLRVRLTKHLQQYRSS